MRIKAFQLVSISAFQVVGLAVLFGLPACGAEFLAGAAKVDLNPPLGIPMSGYQVRHSKGRKDPIEARVLALSDGSRKIAIVTLDLCFPFEPPAMEEIRGKVRGKVDEVIFHASHTHSGPTYAMAPEALAAAIPRVVAAINEAASKLQPARIGTGWGQTYIGFNRRYILNDGSVHMFWRNEPKSTSTFPVDPTVGVIRVDRADGSPIATLVHYACHPVIFGPDNLDYSADYPSEMRKTVEGALGGMAFFLQGAPGDINPYYDKTPLIEDAVEVMKQTGRKLGEEAVRVARTIRTQAPAAASLKSKTVIVQSRNRWNIEKLKQVAQERYRLDASRTARLLRDDMQLPVTTLLINDEIVLAGMPGEPFVEFQMQLRAKSPIPASFLMGYTNGYFAYFPTIAAAVRGGYGANSTVNPTEVGSGERMLNTALISIYDLLGKLKPDPAH